MSWQEGCFLLVFFKYSSDDMYLLSATFASSKPSLEWTQTWRNFIIDSAEYDTIEDFCSNGRTRNSPEITHVFFNLFLGTGMMIALFLYVGASSWFKTMLNICRRYSVSWYFPCFRTSAVTLWSLPGDLPVLMLLVALETSSKVKFSVSILRLCSGGGNLSELVVELVLRSPMKYS